MVIFHLMIMPALFFTMGESSDVLGVMFSDLQVPVGINYKKVKKQIFDEIDNLMIPNQPPMNRQYIESVMAWENPGVERVGCLYMEPFPGGNGPAFAD